MPEQRANTGGGTSEQSERIQPANAGTVSPVSGRPVHEGILDRPESEVETRTFGMTRALVLRQDGSLNPLRAGFRTGFSTSPMDRLALVQDVGVLWQKLDSMERDLSSQGDVGHYAVGVATVASAALSAGYALWAVRGSMLLGSLLSSLPTWAMIDPLPVLDAGDEKRPRGTKAEESLAEIANHSAVDASGRKESSET